ncbi:hypothetical protein CXB51_025726 [Gossypium anomalum]|uniref:Uncharacterized protein n=1 Tax=Gossypium anomalum TaxID=47600 RepID=A0A8J5YK12_9ROSI|nr:hypothetical protein CXB51_025726 [Gossypium anomalum]
MMSTEAAKRSTTGAPTVKKRKTDELEPSPVLTAQTQKSYHQKRRHERRHAKEAVNIAISVFEKNNVEKDVAEYIKKESTRNMDLLGIALLVAILFIPLRLDLYSRFELGTFGFEVRTSPTTNTLVISIWIRKQFCSSNLVNHGEMRGFYLSYLLRLANCMY